MGERRQCFCCVHLSFGDDRLRLSFNSLSVISGDVNLLRELCPLILDLFNFKLYGDLSSRGFIPCLQNTNIQLR